MKKHKIIFWTATIVAAYYWEALTANGGEEGSFG